MSKSNVADAYLYGERARKLAEMGRQKDYGLMLQMGHYPKACCI